MRVTLGIDEAGRGPSIGPMVMAAVALDSKAAAALTRKGLRDSKTYGAGDEAHAIRCDLAAEIRTRALFVATIVVEHTEFDERVCRGELNVLEREKATLLIDQAPKVDKIIADGKRMFAALGARYPHFISCDRAEEEHASVAAASVVAKALRDTRFHAIKQRYEDDCGPITGGGYANAATRKWVRTYVEKYNRLPDEARRTWPFPFVFDLIGDQRPPKVQTELFGLLETASD